MAKRKKQHYVPQFLFRLFSEDEKTINLYNFNNQKYIFNAPFKNQCCESYFYSEKIELEEALGKLENEQAKVLRKIIKNETLETSEEEFYLYLFILLQHHRTKYAKNTHAEMEKSIMDKAFIPLIKSKAKLEGVELGEFELERKNSFLERILFAFTHVPLIMDLKPIVIVNHTKIDFIISDNPVVFHNIYFNRFKGFGSKGCGNKGLKIFCPIHPKVMILFYDDKIYNVLETHKDIIILNKKNDINSLNDLQIIYSESSIYFSNKKQVQNLKNRIKESEHLRNYNKQITESLFNEDKTRELIHTYSQNVPYNLVLSFIKIKEGLKPDPNDQVRNRNALKEYQKELKKFMKDKFNIDY